MKAPPAIVVDGKIQFGRFKSPFREIRLLEAQMPGLPKCARDFRLKEWTHVGLVHPEMYMGAAIVNAKYIGDSFLYMYDRASGAFFEHDRQAPLAKGFKIARELWNADSSVALPGHRILNRNRLDEGHIDFEFDVAERKGTPAVKGSVRLLEDLSVCEPLVVSLPVGPNRTMYSHKAALPAEGELTVGDRTFSFDPARDVGILDVHKAYYPYRTWWNWATFGGFDAQGRLIALNLTRNIALGDPDEMNESALWVGGKCSLFARAEFEFDKSDLMKPWKIKTADGRIELTFTPQGERKGRTAVGPILSDFHQPFGTFSGFAVDDAGERHEIRDSFGVTEYHLSRW